MIEPLFEIWFGLIDKYPNTNMENVALQKIAQRLTQLGSICCNLSMDDFAVLLFKKSLGSFPTPETYIGLVHYYADVRSETRWTYYRSRIFYHLQQATSIVTPESTTAMEIDRLKTWMHYRLRIEAAETKFFRRK